MPDISAGGGHDAAWTGSGRFARRLRRVDRAFEEAVFRQLLRTEGKLACRAGRPLFLVLVRVSCSRWRTWKIPAFITSRVFAALEQAVREADLTGWHRHGRLAAAVLANGGDPLDAQTRTRIRDRVRTALEQRLSAFFLLCTCVRVVELDVTRRSFRR